MENSNYNHGLTRETWLIEGCRVQQCSQLDPRLPPFFPCLSESEHVQDSAKTS